ncbi:NAD-dependent epimerase/dehydratase family protein [Candidatus Falkowbacteria bacterium]|nr:NAD-dependent epimerase/dehydratase family protein [Candidatus Falkowbacteria bacterium]
MKHFKKIGIIVVNLLFDHDYFYKFLGFLNTNILLGRIRGMFLVYPASEKFTKAFVYNWYAKKIKWKPALVGFFRQENKWGIIFGISATEEDFWKDYDTEKLKKLNSKLESIKKIIKADQKNFAGVLPGILAKGGVVNKSTEARATVLAISQAIEILKARENMPDNSPLIVIGAEGFIGNQLVNFLRERGYKGDIHTIDIKLSEKSGGLPRELEGRPTIILNLTKRGALSEYIGSVWSEAVIINEVYPEPSKEELMAIQERGAHCYHVVGLKGKSWPSFPGAYSGGIPCCASLTIPQKGDVIIKKLI